MNLPKVKAHIERQFHRKLEQFSLYDIDGSSSAIPPPKIIALLKKIGQTPDRRLCEDLVRFLAEAEHFHNIAYVMRLQQVADHICKNVIEFYEIFASHRLVWICAIWLLPSLRSQICDWRDRCGNTLLHLAFTQQNGVRVNALLEIDEIDVAARNKMGMVPLEAYTPYILVQLNQSITAAQWERLVVSAPLFFFEDVQLVLREVMHVELLDDLSRWSFHELSSN